MIRIKKLYQKGRKAIMKKIKKVFKWLGRNIMMQTGK